MDNTIQCNETWKNHGWDTTKCNLMEQFCYKDIARKNESTTSIKEHQYHRWLH